MLNARILVAAVIAGALGLASPAIGKSTKYTSGIINSNGSIVKGSGFTVVRNSTGDYTITFPVGVFPTRAPAMTCSPFGANGAIPVCIVFGESWSGSNPTTFNIRLYSLAGAHLDNEFQFTEVTTK